MDTWVVNKFRGAVSRKKRRYQDGAYDLDLTYIKPNLIAMGFPADKLEGVYRNHIDQVVRFLEEKHKDHYKVYNLCAERSYDETKFHSRVAHFPIDDHNPPKIELIQPFCQDVDAWLAKDPQNVAVVHCKAGKGRTGVMICAYLLHRKVKGTANEALSFYDETRTSDHKGVTIPSQKRYVGYYDRLLGDSMKYERTTLLLQGIKFNILPNYSNLALQIVIWQTSSSIDCSLTKIFESLPVENINKMDQDICLEFPRKIAVSGDTLIAVINKPKMMRKERMFQFWFNTYFVDEECGIANNGAQTLKPTTVENPRNTADPSHKIKSDRKMKAAQSFTFDESNCILLTLKKHELDKANKDRSHRLFDAGFQVVCYFEKGASHLPSVSSSNTMTVVESDVSISKTVQGAEADDESLSDSESESEWLEVRQEQSGTFV